MDAGLAGTFGEWMLVGKWSSRKVCHAILGGQLIILKRANLMTGARLREKGV
jgi:hypothetical protein